MEKSLRVTSAEERERGIVVTVTATRSHHDI